MEKFDFNYQINDWKERKKLVDKYVEENKIIEKINDLIIKNTVPIKFNKDGEPEKYHVLRDKELTELNRLIIRLYDYILYAYDKELVKPKQDTPEQQQALIDNEQGIKSFIDKRKRGTYKEPKWALIDEDVLKQNQDKLKRFEIDTGLIIYKQIITYQDLKFKVANMNRDGLENKKLIRLNLITDLCQDIKICEECCNSVNKVYISEGIRSKHDILSNIDIEYNKKIIRTVLNNWNDICNVAEQHPTSIIHDIKMDFEKALNDINLTKRQEEVLYLLINHENIREYTRDIDFIISKFEKILKK